MIKMKTALLFSTCLLALAVHKLAFAQDYSAEAKEHFCKYLDIKSQMNFMKEALPSLDDCKLVFKGKSAYTYFGYIEDMKRQLNPNQQDNETFADCRIRSFTTYDIQQGKGNYAGGMKKIKDMLQPNVTFYRVTYLREKDAEFGVSYKYFVNIKGKWVFFPKPWEILD